MTVLLGVLVWMRPLQGGVALIAAAAIIVGIQSAIQSDRA
jgi:hypothetical protein